MKRDKSTTGDEITAGRPGGKSLKESYQSHDVGHAYVVDVLESRGYDVVDWGIDMRDDDGDDGVIYDDKMDLKVYDGNKLAGFIDVKTKTKPKWMGQFNERHYNKYLNHARDSGLPTLIVMSLVADDTPVDTFVTDVSETRPFLSSKDDWVRSFPDGNNKCIIPHEHRNDINYLFYKLGRHY